MSQPIPAEEAGATAEQAQPNPAGSQSLLDKVLTDMSHLYPARDQSPPGGAGSGQKCTCHCLGPQKHHMQSLSDFFFPASNCPSHPKTMNYISMLITIN